MEVSTAIRGRRSIRHYLDKEIEPEKLQMVLEAARLAPSANNRQQWKFIVVKDAVRRKKLAEACSGQDFIAEAPVVIVACGAHPESVMMCGQPRYTVDISIAVSFILLEAWELGLGTCWIGAFDENKVKDVVKVPGEVRVVAVTPLGYPAGVGHTRPRKPLDQVVCYEEYR